MLSMSLPLLLSLAACTNLVTAGSLFDGSASAKAYQTFRTASAGSFDHTHVFGRDGDEVSVSWRINTDDGTIDLGVAAAAKGWVGFGIGDAGGMPGADMVVFEAAANTLQDYYGVAYARPILDTCASDWKLQDSIIDSEADFIAFQATRALDTGDDQDRAIVFDGGLVLPATRILAAWGDQETMQYHGPNNSGKSAVRFFGDSISPVSPSDTDVVVDKSSMDAVTTAITALEDMSDGSVLVASRNYTIPTVETTYHNACYNVTDLLTPEQAENGVYLIGAKYSPSIENNGIDNKPHLHHLAGQGSVMPCPDENSYPQGILTYYAWAPGGQPVVLPENVGIKVGGTDGIRSLNINVHYDNRNGDEGQIDSSGIQWFFVEESREFQAGSLVVGDATVSLRGQLVGEGPSGHVFKCPSSCTQAYFPEPVTIVNEYLHLHETGARIVNEIIRDGVVINKASTDNFDFNANGIHAINQKTFQVLPGDEFRTKCFYDGKSTTRFGLATQEEMCQSIMLYYPLNPRFHGYCGPNFPDPQCAATYTNITDKVDSSFNRTFGTSSECPADERESGTDESDMDTNTEGSGSDSSIIIVSFFAAVLSMVVSLFA